MRGSSPRTTKETVRTESALAAIAHEQKTKAGKKPFGNFPASLEVQ
jgi:hypothetical protein